MRRTTMPAGRAAVFGAAATVVGAYALQDHLRSRAARREEEDQKRAIMEMLEREAEEGPMGLRGTEEGYAFKRLEDARFWSSSSRRAARERRWSCSA